MTTEINAEEQPSPSAVPLILTRPFKSLLRTPVYIKHRRLRRSDYFLSMNDNCACIPPGTPVSLVSQRTATTTESNETSSPVKNVSEDNESVPSRLDKATESVSDAGACGTSVSWSLLSLPTMQKINHIVQFTPSQDVSTDDDILHDSLLGVIGLNLTSDQEIPPENLSLHEGDSERQLQRLAMRPLLASDDIMQQRIRDEHVNSTSECNSPPKIGDVYMGVIGPDKIERTDDVSGSSLRHRTEDFHIPDVPVIRSLLYPVVSLQALGLNDPRTPTNYDMNIPKEIFCYQEDIEEDTTETMVDLDQLHESIHAGKSLTSPCLLPCPKDQPFRRRHRRFSDPRDRVPDTEASFFDIICRHQHLTMPQSDEEHSIPMIVIEVDHRKQNELPPKDVRQRRRSRAKRDYQRRWQRKREAGLHPRIDDAPEYASV